MTASTLDWQDAALCAQTDPAEFFPNRGSAADTAKTVCFACDVRRECLDYALANDEQFGIWGGMSLRERRRIAAARTAPALGGAA